MFIAGAGLKTKVKKMKHKNTFVSTVSPTFSHEKSFESRLLRKLLMYSDFHQKKTKLIISHRAFVTSQAVGFDTRVGRSPVGILKVSNTS
ncbi:hypothetical protein TNCV_786761 [Trichonephila clavipes]|nr:hypothetical protein TNCV_786761 [Trichonephila clavipes]